MVCRDFTDHSLYFLVIRYRAAYHVIEDTGHFAAEFEVGRTGDFLLENVLIPYKLSENILLLKEAGFAHCEIFFKWYNFSGVIAKKKML